MLILFALLGCPTGDDTSSADECPHDVELGEDDVGCACGDATMEWYAGCAYQECVDTGLYVEDSSCCKAEDGC